MVGVGETIKIRCALLKPSNAYAMKKQMTIVEIQTKNIYVISSVADSQAQLL